MFHMKQTTENMGGVIDLVDATARELRDKLICPKTHNSPEDFINCEYPRVDPRGKQILALMHRYVCNRRGRDLRPEEIITRSGKTKRLIRELEAMLDYQRLL